MRQKNPIKATIKPSSAAESSNSTVNVVGSLLRFDRLPDIFFFFFDCLKFPERDDKNDAFKNHRQTKHDIIPRRVFERRGMNQCALCLRKSRCRRRHRRSAPRRSATRNIIPCRNRTGASRPPACLLRLMPSKSKPPFPVSTSE